MNYWIKSFLQEMANACEFAECYKENNNVLHLMSAGSYRESAFHYLFNAKEEISKEEWKIWSEIYWDFYRDLNNFVLE